MYKMVWYIVKKECGRFFKDRRMILMVIILPALLMYGIYAILGQGLQETMSVDEDYRFQCCVQNLPASYESIFAAMNFEVAGTENADAAKESVTNKDADLVVLFPTDFDDRLLNPSADGTVPNIQVYYSNDSTESRTAYQLFLTATEQLETSMVNILDVNRDVENPDISSGSSLLISAIPMIVMSLLFASCSSVATESIAGEKERGTFATLLVTPVSRTAIAVGKIISLSFFAVLGGLSSFIGLLMGMRDMLGNVDGSIPVYSSTEYAWLLLLIISAVMLTISVLSVISAFARSVKEANTSVTFVTTFGLLAGMVNMLPFSFSGILWRCVPILGAAISLNDICMMKYSTVDITITCVSNLVFTFVLVFALSKMFNSEKIMFNKT